MNFRSIASCDVKLGPLTVLVGPNGSGKTNFLDALRFVRDAVDTTPYQAIKARGGLNEILRRVPAPSGSLRVELDMVLPYGPLPDQLIKTFYGFEIEEGVRPGRPPVEVAWEKCEIQFAGGTRSFSVERGTVVEAGSSFTMNPRITPDRLYLPLAAATPNYEPVLAFLSHQRFYGLRPDVLRQLRPESTFPILGEAGEYLGDVLGELREERPDVKEHLDGYLASIAPSLTSVDRRLAGDYITVEARQSTGPDGAPVVFGPEAMSDGTIRAAGVLAALFQMGVRRRQVTLVAIEEPETALHPAAAGVLFDALTEASQECQVIATTQSDDLLDHDEVDPTVIRAVRSDAGHTRIGRLTPAALRAVNTHQFTAGELMRAGQLQPDVDSRQGHHWGAA